MPAPSVRERRMVVEWPDGQVQIIGITDKQPPEVFGSVMPCSLIAAKRTYYLYRPIAAPLDTPHFHASQQ